MLQEIRKHTPRVIFKLFQRRLLDKNAEISAEEMRQGVDEIEDQIHILNSRISQLQAKADLMRKLIDGKGALGQHI